MKVSETKVYARIKSTEAQPMKKIAVGIATFHAQTRLVVISISKMPIPTDGYFTLKVPARWERERKQLGHLTRALRLE